MTVNWGTVVASVISGIVVSWPGVAATVWLSHRRLRGHIDQRTDRQTTEIRDLTESQTSALVATTNEQTRELLGRRGLFRRSNGGGPP